MPESKSAKLARYRGELERSRQWREEDEREPLWERMVDLYRGLHYDGLSGDERLIVNQAFAMKNVIAPSVAISNPKFTASARKPDAQAQSIIAEEVLNYLWRTHKAQKEFRLAVDDYLVIGHGWIKTGYKYVKEAKEVTPSPEYGDPDQEPGVDDREPVEGNVESETRVKEDRPFVERVSPFDMYVDPDARSEREMRWIAQRIRRPIVDVKVDKRYKQSVRKDVQADTWDRYGDDEMETKNLRGYIDIIEFYDLKMGTMCVFAPNGPGRTRQETDGQDGFLIEPRKIPYTFGHPFVMLRNYEITDVFYPMGELEQIYSLQLELNETRTQMLNHRKRFARKYLYDPASFNDEGVKALNSDEDNTMVPVVEGSNLSEAVMPMPSIGTPPEFYNQSDIIQADMDNISGVSDYMRGQSPNIRRTATEAAMIQDSQNSRAADKLASIEYALAEIGGRIIQLMQQYMTGEQTIRIVGSRERPVWFDYDNDYIQGEFDFEVEAGSTQPNNESFRRQQALDLLNAMGPFIGSGVVDAKQLARHVLQFGFGLKNADQFMTPDQAPQAPQPPSALPSPDGGMPNMPPGMEGMPPGMEAGPAPTGMPMSPNPDMGQMSPSGDLPPELLAQLAQMQAA